MKKGFTKSWRKELESDIWKMPYLYHRIFYFLRQTSSWKINLFPSRKIGIWVCPGMQITSISEIANGVSYVEYGKKRTPNKKTVDTVLKWLESNGMIARESNAFGTTIYVMNWHTYQSDATEEVTVDIQEEGETVCPTLCPTVCPTVYPHLKNSKEVLKNNKEEKTKTIVHPKMDMTAFYSFWKEFPRKVSRQASIKAWTKLSPSAELVAEIMAGLEKHKATEQWTNHNGQYIPHASTWLNGRRWEDEIKEGKPSCSAPPSKISESNRNYFEELRRENVIEESI